MIESIGAYPYQSFEFNASQGQTTFNGTDRFGQRLEYELNKTTVYLNGVKLKATTDKSNCEFTLNSLYLKVMLLRKMKKRQKNRRKKKE